MRTAAFAAAMAAACPAGHADAGVPCWSLWVDWGTGEGLCGRRIRACGFRGQVGEHAAKTKPGLSLDRRIAKARADR